MNHDVEAPKPIPWEDWELDPEFFTALTHWTLLHPESALDRVLGKVSVAIEHGRDFMEFIPDSPFPARSLVNALAHLIKLGETMSSAKSDVQVFAKEVINWVSEIKKMFDSARGSMSRWIGGGDFTTLTWRNLANMRDLIDEICKWASARLTDRRWSFSGIRNKLVINAEILEFRSRISDARKLFNDRSIICMSWGIDSILQVIRRLFIQQDRIIWALEKIRVTEAEHLTHILDKLETQEQAETQRRDEEEKFRRTEERRRYVNQMLASHVVANPTYVDQGKPPCDKDTRVAVLADIMAWINDVTEASQNFLWLTGDPGCGKSAVTASIARDCKDTGTLWAQFFINRNNVDTTNPNSYFPSIARQLVDRSDVIERDIYDKLKSKPSLMDKMSSDQAASLFIDAIRVASSLDRARPVVIVIDGLDETDRTFLRHTAEIFSQLFPHLPWNAKVLISSRTEDEIQKPFTRTFDNKHVKHIHLDTGARSSIDDVAGFLRRKVAHIVLDNDLDWRIWPSDERMDVLAKRASGLFIWAVTVAKFLQVQINALGTECLSDVLDMLNAEAMGDINALYNVILKTQYGAQKDPWEFEKFRRILGALVVLQEPLPLAALSLLLDLRRSPTHPSVDIQHFVRRLRTVLVAGTDSVHTGTVPRLHKSFFEFLTGPHIDPIFHIDTNAAHLEMAIHCLRQLAVAKSSTVTSRMHILLRYALRFWSVHMMQTTGGQAGAIIMDPTLSLPEFQDILRFSSNETHSGPLNIVFSPDRSLILSSVDNHVRSWDAMSGQQCEKVLKGHANSVWSVAFSPDGKYVISGSADKSIRLWDASTGLLARPPFEGHSNMVSSVNFSPDGRTLVSGSWDHTIRFWDPKTGQCTESPITSHTNNVLSALFSPSGEYLVSVSADKTIQLWNIAIGEAIGSPFAVHSDWVRSVAFSPDGTKIVSCSDDKTIRLWDSKTRTPIGQPFGNTSGTNSIAFSPDGKTIASGSNDNNVHIWDARTGRPVPNLKPFAGHTRRVLSVAFSPDSQYVVSASADTTVRLWDVQSGRPIGSPFIGHSDWVRSVAFSPNGKHIVSGSDDKTIIIWDVPDDVDGSAFTAFSPLGTHLVSAALDHAVRIWDSSTQCPVGRLLDGDTEKCRSIAFSPNGALIAGLSLGRTLYLWSVTTRCLLSTASIASMHCPTSLSFTADSRNIVVMCDDETSSMWTVVDEKLQGPVPTSDRERQAVFFDVTQQPQSIYGGGRNMFLERVRWFPTNDQDSCLWAYIDDHIIKAGKDGSISIVQVSRGTKRGP
ncbi:Vegetative incompatibility protein HET-E-1 [Hypsizygus marmoreus]|uniref:Vegetative incompatibility protein HET-E-1 n=1 Tax=Hypsizygus marmoreus TaxID=39966 RepID=A0A369J570_HYPMA|nr:Vegetative incompatibility protein HET-E-1 [Hypsizygus marmoreus]